VEWASSACVDLPLVAQLAANEGPHDASVTRDAACAILPAMQTHTSKFLAVIKVFAAAPIALAFTAIALLPAHAQDAASKARAAAVLNSLPKAKNISEAALSPDGTQVALIEEGVLSIAPAKGGPAHGILLDVSHPTTARDVAWSVDGKSLAYIAEPATGDPSGQVWVMSPSGMKKVADMKGYVASPRFSPDGRTLAVLYIENMPRKAGPLEPMTPLSGEIDSHIYEQRIATIDLATGKVAQITAPDMYVYEFDWTPDSKTMIAIAAHGEGDSNWYIAHIYSIDPASGATQDIYTPKYQIAEPRVSPDGKSVAFIEGLMSDEGSTGGDVFLLPIGANAVGTPKNLTPDAHFSPRAIAWITPTALLVSQLEDGNSQFAVVNATPGEAHPLWTMLENARPASHDWVAPLPAAPSDGIYQPVVAVLRQSAVHPPEVWAGDVAHTHQITHFNDDVKPTWGEMRSIHWMNGSTRVQGWLMLPANYDASKKYPLVVVVHGGPSAACENRWSPWTMDAASTMGWFALCPNPRGSFGQGEAFVRGNVKDFGGGDFQDIMAGVDQLLKDFPIDPKRLGIYGHSYGGYVTMWAETQTNRFAAAVAGAGLSDWLSYYGVNDLDQWMIPFFGASIYDDPAVYAKSDPMHFVKNVKTPTLILVGDRDGEVPPEQSVEWWHALKTAGVPVTLVVYPNEGHGLVVPANAYDYSLRTIAWFDQWFTKATQ
jgi:dipeptidyl aminopeptidase/acylaminoacyl peptidase